jgi:hypothetical protein
VKVFIQGLYGPNSGQTPGIFAAAVATVLVSPAQERIQRWSEQRFQRNLVKLREDLPTACASFAKARRWTSCSTKPCGASKQAFERRVSQCCSTEKRRRRAELRRTRLPIG